MKRARRVFLACAMSALATLPVFVLPETAWAAAIHAWSYGEENTSGGFTGLSAVRQDVHVGNLPNTGCSAPYSGGPVYQTQWVGSDSGDWKEIGTGHQCQDNYRYWFWGYGVAGTWHSIGFQTGISNGVSHTFKISRAFNGSTNVYIWQIDGATKATQSSSATFQTDQAGLESYNGPPTFINVYNISSLQAQRNGGSFVSWSGRDRLVVTHSALCGKWISDTTYRAGESTPCP